MKRLLAALFATALVLAGTTTATADHSGDGQFEFLVAIDTDGDRGKLENQATQVIYHRNLDTHTLDAEAGWTDGDRKAYTCGYAFLRYRGFIVARVHIARFNPDGAPAYVGVQDRYMHEGALNFDGTVPVEGNTTQDGKQLAVDDGKSCPGLASEEYEPHAGPFDAPPVVTFQHGPHAIDVRDFADSADVDVDDPTIHWQLFEQSPTKVTVLAYHADNLPVVALYYELVGDPDQGLTQGDTIPGTMHPVTMHVGCGLDCGGHEGHEEPTEEPTVDPTPDPEPTTEPGC